MYSTPGEHGAAGAAALHGPVHLHQERLQHTAGFRRPPHERLPQAARELRLGRCVPLPGAVGLHRGEQPRALLCVTRTAASWGCPKGAADEVTLRNVVSWPPGDTGAAGAPADSAPAAASQALSAGCGNGLALSPAEPLDELTRRNVPSAWPSMEARKACPGGAPHPPPHGVCAGFAPSPGSWAAPAAGTAGTDRRPSSALHGSARNSHSAWLGSAGQRSMGGMRLPSITASRTERSWGVCPSLGRGDAGAPPALMLRG